MIDNSENGSSLDKENSVKAGVDQKLMYLEIHSCMSCISGYIKGPWDHKGLYYRDLIYNIDLWEEKNLHYFRGCLRLENFTFD